MKCSCHMAFTSPSLVNSLSLLFTIPTFFGPSFHDLAASYTLFTWPCCPASSDSRATLVIQSLLSFLRLFITSLPFSLYSLLALFLLPFRSCTICRLLKCPPFLDLSPTFCADPALKNLSPPQYAQCRFIVGGLDLMPPLLYVVGWVRLLTVLVVICIRVVLVWRLKDDESIPQVELKLLSDLKYSQFLSLLSLYVADPTCFLLVLLNSSLALVKTRLWSLPTSPHLCTLVSSREITTLQFLLHLLKLTHKHTHKVL